MRGSKWNDKFGSELGRPQRPVQIQRFVRMVTGDSNKGYFLLFYFQTNPAKDIHQLRLCGHVSRHGLPGPSSGLNSP